MRVKKEFVMQVVSEKMKVIRTERDFSQEKMAGCLGISKKTLVQIEKGRVMASWNVVVATVALFSDSDSLQNKLGDEPLEVLRLIAHTNVNEPRDKTMGGRMWWVEIESNGNFRLQQNLISKHYRILDKENYRWFSSFDQAGARERLKELGSQSEWQ